MNSHSDALILSVSKDEAAGTMPIFVYMLLCADDSYYVGIARDGLEKRVSEHQLGKYRGYTFKRRPVRLVWSESFLRLTDAIACERRIKGWRREKKQALIRGDYDALKLLSRTAKPHPSAGRYYISRTQVNLIARDVG